jgi:hypothetical protein
MELFFCHETLSCRGGHQAGIRRAMVAHQTFSRKAWRIDLLTACRRIECFQVKDVDVGKFCTQHKLTAQLTTELTSSLFHQIHLLYEAQGVAIIYSIAQKFAGPDEDIIPPRILREKIPSMPLKFIFIPSMPLKITSSLQRH